MSSRTSAGVGVMVTMALLGTFTVAFFILAIVFLSKWNTMKTELQTVNRDLAQYVKPNERQDDGVRAILAEANKSGSSALGYLSKSYQDTMQAVTGNKRDTFASFQGKLKGIAGAEGNNLLGVIETRDQELAALKARAEEADAARKSALADRQAEVDRVKGIEERHQQTIAALEAQIGEFQKELDKYREGTNNAKTDMDAQLAKVRAEAEAKESDLLAKIAKLQEEGIVKDGVIADLRGKNAGNTVKGEAEFSLVDANVVGVNPSAGTCTISIGRKQKLKLGMTFAVYADANTLKPDKRTGDLPPGKAQIEVINVGETSSTCRIVAEAKGNPVLNGDVIVNGVYDPNKMYKFLIYGNFDTNGDGVATPLERSDLQAIIEAWNGRVVDDLSGDVDFLVLGERPVLPPRPGPDSPVEILQEYIRLNRVIERYDDLLKKAQQTGLPLLNENRLNTLIGRTPSSR